MTWEGAPKLAAEGGWSFKPRGRLQLDSAGVNAPKGIAGQQSLGIATEFRRAYIGFDGTMPSTQSIPPLDWRVDAFELVWGGGHPYRYDTLGRWQLGPPVMTASQPSLF